MDPVRAAQYVVLVLGILLLVKLLASGLHKLYLIFCCFLAADLSGSVLWVVNTSVPFVDERFIWLIDRVIVWIFMFWTVIALLDAVLKNYPGILRLSRNVLRGTLATVIGIGLLSAIPEYAATSHDHAGWLARSVTASFVIERVVSSVSLGCLLTVLIFLLWFPVEVPRNLAVFCVGFVVYFLIATGVLLANNYLSTHLRDFVSITANIVESACLAYWFLFISKSGEFTRSRLSIHWRGDDQNRLIAQLESLNQSLVRSSSH